MPSRESKALDSPIWMNPASMDDPLGRLVMPSNMGEIAKQARDTSETELKDRTRRFRARATQQTLSKPVK
jgi:hypothetical protein